jgi:tripartite-type tricarboxylate transporter receptor subunit TctC
MPYFADRVKDTTTTTGTGAVTLAGAAPSGYQTFASGFGSSSQVVGYCIAGQTGTEWEVGTGTFNGTTGLTRDRVRASSNSNALVSFSAGTKDVFCTAPARSIDNANAGYLYAMSRGFAMP